MVLVPSPTNHVFCWKRWQIVGQWVWQSCECRCQHSALLRPAIAIDMRCIINVTNLTNHMKHMHMHMNLFYRASAWQQFLSKSNLVISIFSSPNLYWAAIRSSAESIYLCWSARLGAWTQYPAIKVNVECTSFCQWGVAAKACRKISIGPDSPCLHDEHGFLPNISLISRSTICSAVCTASEQQPPLAHIKPNVLKAMSKSPCCWILPLRNHLCKRIIMSTVKWCWASHVFSLSSPSSMIVA